MRISGLISWVVQFIVKSPTPEEMGRVLLEADLMVTRCVVNPPMLGFDEGFYISDDRLTCMYYSKDVMGDDGKFVRREVLMVEVKDRIGKLVAAFIDDMPTAWRMGLERAYRPSITWQQVHGLRSMLSGAQKAVAISMMRGARSV